MFGWTMTRYTEFNVRFGMNDHVVPPSQLDAMVTAFAPLLSLRVLRSVLHLDNHLLNLSMQALVALVLVQGLLGTAGRAAVAGVVQGQTPQIADLLVGLTADVAGSMILILGVALVWRLQRHLRGGGGSSDV